VKHDQNQFDAGDDYRANHGDFDRTDSPGYSEDRFKLRHAATDRQRPELAERHPE
jgi:hypothetical protein